MPEPQLSPMTPQDEAVIASQLGREPRGVAGVAWRCPCGKPGVVATEPRLPNGTPFPTTYYLTCPRAVSGCSTLEASGLMAEMSQRLLDDPELASAYRAAHESYLADRAAIGQASVGEVPEIEGISAGGMPSRVKCLHVLVGHALAKGPGVNPLGDEAVEKLGEFWQRPCGGSSSEERASVETITHPQTVAAIDCGTNSIRLLIASQGADGALVEHQRLTTMVRLGQGVDATGEFHPDALQRTFDACDVYAAEIAQFGGVDKVRFVATSAARDARNRDVFAAGVRARFGVDPVVVAGDEEARLSFTGAAAGVPGSADPVLVMDIGGGSTELIRGEADQIVAEQSLDMGAVRLRERFLHDDPPTAEQIEQARSHVRALLDECRVPFDGIGTFIGVAGTATTMAAVDAGLPRYERTLVHRHELSLDVIEQTAQRWLTSTVEQVRREPAMHPQRAEIICAGGLVLAEVARRVGRPLIVSESDILDGIAMDLLGADGD